MRHKKAVLVTATILSLPVFLAIAIMLFLQTHWFSRFASNYISDQWDRQVQWQHPLTIDWSLSPVFSADDLQLADAAWTNRAQMLTADQIAVQIGLPHLLRGVLDIEHVKIVAPELHLVSSRQDGNNWDPFITDDAAEEPLLELRIGGITLQNGLVIYAAPDEQTQIRIEVDNEAGEALQLGAEGEILDESFTASIAGGPIAAAVRAHGAVDDDASYSLQGSANWRNHRLQFDGSTRSLTWLSGLKLDANADGSDIGEILALFGYDIIDAAYELEAQVEYLQTGHAHSTYRGFIGHSEFQGMLNFKSRGKRPQWEAQLEISEVNLDALEMGESGAGIENDTDNYGAEGKVGIDGIKQQLVILQSFDADIRIDIGRLQKNGVVVQNLQSKSGLLNGRLDQRLSTSLGGGDILWTLELDTAREGDPIGQTVLAVDMVDLGQALEPMGFAALGSLNGELGLDLRSNALTVDESQLRYQNPAENSDIVVRLANHEINNDTDGVHVEMSGQVNGDDFVLDLATGPLLDLAEPEDSYPIEGRLEFSDNSVSVKGTLEQPLLLAGMDMDVTIIGDSPENLASLPVGFLHEMPPFKVSANLANNPNLWGVRDLEGKAGDSDLSGEILIKKRGHQRPLIEADLVSEKLVVAQLLPPTAEDGPNDEEQNETEDGSDVLPENDLLQESLKLADARVEYDAQEIDAAGISLNDVSIELRLEDGLLTLDPVAVGVGSGTVNLSVDVDATDRPSNGSANIEVSRVGLGDLLEPLDAASETMGLIGGEGNFRFSGASLADVMASLDGEMELVMTDGQLDAVIVAAAGLDLGELLVLLFGDEEAVDIRCAYTRMAADDGQLAIEPMLIITSERNIVGDGNVNFEEETFEFEVEAKSQDFSLLSAASPVRIEGKFSDPELDILSDELIARGALAAAGGAIFPPAALLGLVETGDDEGENGCHQAVASADTARDRSTPD